MQPLLAPPRQDLDEADVVAVLALEHGVKVRHGVDVLDTNDDPTGETLPISATDGGEVVWTYRPPDSADGPTVDAAAVRRQATIVLAGDVQIPLIARRFRPWIEMLAPSGVWVRFWLGVFVATLPPVDDDGTVIRRRLSLADKAYRWANRKLADTLTVTAATNNVQWVIDDLADRFDEADTDIPSSDVTLQRSLTWPAGTSILAVYNALLEAAAYDHLSTTEAGRPTSQPLSDLAGQGAEVTYGPGQSKIVTAGTVDPLLPDVPNVVRFVARNGPSLAEEGNGIFTVRNESTGPGSIDERGEEVELVVEVTAESQDQLEELAESEAQRYFAGGGLRFTGQVGLNPRHGNRDVIGLDKPRLGLDGVWLVTEWRQPLRQVNNADAVLTSIVCERRVEVT